MATNADHTSKGIVSISSSGRDSRIKHRRICLRVIRLISGSPFPSANRPRHRRQKLQLPHQPPRHEKNADTDPYGEQHIDHCTTHPVEPAAAAIVIKVLLIFAFPS